MAYVAAAYLAAGALIAFYLWTLRSRRQELERIMRRTRRP